MSHDVTIVGAGLAGMSAGVRLAEAGYSVLILESKPHIGGRTASWNANGMHIETGLHRVLGFYTALPELLSTCGVSIDDIVCWEDEIEILTENGLQATFGLSPLHKPLKTIWDGFGHLDLIGLQDRLHLTRMMLNSLELYKKNPSQLDKHSVYSYAVDHGLSEEAIHNVLIPMTEGIFFLPIEQYSMLNFTGLIAPYIGNLHKLRVGAFLGGMTDVMMQPMKEFIESNGGQVKTATMINDIIVDGERVVGVKTNDGAIIKSKQTILATTMHVAQKLLKKSFPKQKSFANFYRLKSMPAVTFQLELSMPSMQLDRTTFGPGTALASFAEQSRTTFQDSAGRLSVILAEPNVHIKKTPEELRDIVVHDAGILGLELENTVKDYRKVSLPHDFYNLGIGNDRLRPSQATDIPGLTLAGDYTAQIYLATMEGAVVSGRNAAGIVEAALVTDKKHAR